MARHQHTTESEGHRLVTSATSLFRILGRRATTSLADGDVDAAVGWVSIAAEQAWNSHPGFFVSHELEELLLTIAEDLPTNETPNQTWASRSMSSRRVLHVLTEAYGSGGHTRLTERWVRLATARGEVHSVVLLQQGEHVVPPWLIKATEECGGTVTDLSPLESVDKAARLRDMWLNGPDVVISNVHPHDPVPILAFGIDSGPPIVWMNHADHVFWLGVSVADEVLDLRPSGQQCTLQRRGARSSHILPVPMTTRPVTVPREEMRRRLGISEDACLLLTVGSAYKYAPLGSWRFPDLLGEVLLRCPTATLVAVGPTADWGWREFVDRFPGRVRALGVIDDLGSLYTAADLYVESVPLAGLTATLEAALAGLPVHLAQMQAPLMSNDDLALDGWKSHCQPEEYVDALAQLISGADDALGQANNLRQAVDDVHASEVWIDQVSKILDGVSEHTVSKPGTAGTATAADYVWAEFQRSARLRGTSALQAHRGSLRRIHRVDRAIREVVSSPPGVWNPRSLVALARDALV